MLNPNSEGFPLSLQQRRLALFQAPGTTFCAQCALVLRGDLDRAALESAVAEVIGRHEILRTTFHRRPGMKVPFQAIRGEAQAAWETIEVPAGSGLEGVDLEGLLRKQRQRPFDLEYGPLVRLSLARLGEREHLLLMALPSLCADASTLANLAAEIGRSCAGEAGSDEALQYVDFADWQEEIARTEDEEIREGKAFWQRQGAPSAAPLGIPGEKSPAGRRLGDPRNTPVDLSPEMAEALHRLAERPGVSLASLLLAGWAALLARVTGRSDLTLGVGFDGRPYERLAEALGLFARRLPLRAPLAPGLSFLDLAGQLHDALQRGAKSQEAGWGEDGGASTAPLAFGAAFELDRWPFLSLAEGFGIEILRQRVHLEPFEVKLSCLETASGLSLELLWDPQLLDDESARALAGRLGLLLARAALAPETLADDLEILLEAERRQLLESFGAGGEASALAEPVHRVFERQAARVPGRTAVAFGEEALTYAELDRRAEALADRLVELGVGPEDRVALCLDRSAEMVVSMLAVLKSGAAYVPLEPAFPQERLALMLEEAEVSAAVATPALAGRLPAGIACVDPGEGAAVRRRARTEPQGRQLAYTLFTSGSTGRPKGVAVEHRSLMAYVGGVLSRMDLPEGCSFAMVSTFAADLGLTALFPALCTGGTLHVIPQGLTSDPDGFGEYVQAAQIDVLKIVPSHLEALLSARSPQQVLPRRLLVLGGEALRWDLFERIREMAPSCRVMNHYGPTETTVGVLTHTPASPGEGATVPLGRPLPGARVFIFDPQGRPVPPGVAGEIHVGGATVTRGYLRRPDLTAERFGPDALSGEAGARLYRTGDLGRFLPGGECEFLGRVDHQVKLRGFRIELGEIEAALRRQPGVRDAVVVLRRDGGAERLVAYGVPRAGERIDTGALRDALARQLPEYMIPAAFVLLEALPLTPNGKVDRAALPEPGREGAASKAEHVPPRTPVEEILVTLWKDVLGIERVGVHDNFFELGGDSILAIQVTARANQMGLDLAPTLIFQHHTVAELAAASSARRATFAQGLVAGTAPLTPIQRWLMELAPAELHHWNQSLLFEIDEIDPALLAKSVSHLVHHHDALRLRFEKGPDGWMQRFGPPDDASFAAVDLSALPEPLQAGAIEQGTEAAQARFDLGRGPLLRVIAFLRGPGRTDRLFLVAHHLVVDGVSWRVLLEDIQSVYRQLQEGRPVSLPAKTLSFKDWAVRLVEHVRGGACDAELPLWREMIAQPGDGVPLARPQGANGVTGWTSLGFRLSAEDTQDLLQEVPAVYRTQINEALLTALARAFSRWSGEPSLLVNLEGHGREWLFEGVDLSRTVGWFTTHFPVRLTVEPGASPGEDLRSIKEQLRRIPNQGIGYGLLRYLSEDPAVRSILESGAQPRVGFNYLGQFDQVLGAGSRLRPAPEAKGTERSPRGVRAHLLAVSASVRAGRLRIYLTYAQNVFEQAAIMELGRGFLRELRSLIEHCRAAKAGEASVSDFPLAGLREDELASLSAVLDSNEDGEPDRA